ncbi:MAG: hypothetical protein COT88_00475 [Candidatus Colwellbacteria bacterium CG10_big_fil_rev_8_21_14_0_10_41_28]|uniref:Uncharacterized protein n=1 Tax=Candidatus Colwellbacteria bacterium CG10_big_fil_rev_8_21_14_0_10_41_28 TaxID=1974539 RepID=A0A2H0VHS5_9BACT|nr:MAG: hypothetical protein COT88_00475 [Candidatus Colwellbacteria bacterium CG10_big_fil_rev_8_21_14_0_10_41_28]
MVSSSVLGTRATVHSPPSSFKEPGSKCSISRHIDLSQDELDELVFQDGLLDPERQRTPGQQCSIPAHEAYSKNIGAHIEPRCRVYQMDSNRSCRCGRCEIAYHEIFDTMLCVEVLEHLSHVWKDSRPILRYKELVGEVGHTLEALNEGFERLAFHDWELKPLELNMCHGCALAYYHLYGGMNRFEVIHHTVTWLWLRRFARDGGELYKPYVEPLFEFASLHV